MNSVPNKLTLLVTICDMDFLVELIKGFPLMYNMRAEKLFDKNLLSMKVYVRLNKTCFPNVLPYITTKLMISPTSKPRHILFQLKFMFGDVISSS